MEDMDYNQAAETFLSCVKSRSKTEVMSRFSKYAHGEQLVLVGLYKNTGSPILPSDIAKETNMSTARVATILNNLEEKGLVTREISRTDRRKILVAITAKGREEAEQSRKEAVSRIVKILERMGEERTKSFVENVQLFFDLAMEIFEEENEKV